MSCDIKNIPFAVKVQIDNLLDRNRELEREKAYLKTIIHNLNKLIEFDVLMQLEGVW